VLKTINTVQYDLFKTDFEIMGSRLLGSLNKVLLGKASFARPVIEQVINIGKDHDFQEDTMLEFDLLQEAANMEKGRQWLSRVANDFDHPEDHFRVPKVQKSSGHAMLMEHVQGLNLLEKLQEANPVNDEIEKSVVKNLLEIYLHGLLVGPILHADLHPGNVMLDDCNRLVLVDWGIVVGVPSEFRPDVYQLLSCLVNNKGLGREATLKKLLTKMECAPKSCEPVQYTQLGNLFDVVAGAEGKIELPLMLTEMNRIAWPRWVILWQKATGALVTSLVHLKAARIMNLENEMRHLLKSTAFQKIASC